MATQPLSMDVVQTKAWVKNIYAAALSLEGSPGIPVGEGVQIARIIMQTLLPRESIDVPKV